MEHKGTVSIETERLMLRRFRISDSIAAFNNWTSDDKVTEFLTWKTHESIADTQDIFDSMGK